MFKKIQCYSFEGDCQEREENGGLSLHVIFIQKMLDAKNNTIGKFQNAIMGSFGNNKKLSICPYAKSIEFG